MNWYRAKNFYSKTKSMEELLALKKNIQSGNYKEALEIVDELEAMSTLARSYAD